MRSSKSRSRSKNNNNRNRSGGNVTNRVFDSSGPEGKVRGTPQQIIEKYNQLTRDAVLSNDRVAAENFQQHSEHYTRMLSHAQKELDAKREQQEREQRDRQQQQQNQRAQQNDPQRQPEQRQPEQRQPEQRQPEQRPEAGADTLPAFVTDPSQSEQPDIAPSADPIDSGLVETPEAIAPKPRRARKPRAKPAAKVIEDAAEPAAPTEDAPKAAE